MSSDEIPQIPWYLYVCGAIAVIALIVYAVVSLRAKARRRAGGNRADQVHEVYDADRIVTASQEATTGAAATKLALGAVMAVQNHEPWNTIALPSSLRSRAQQMIGNPGSWAIDDTDDLMAAVGRMLDEKFGDDDVDLVMAVRRDLAQSRGGVMPSPQEWLAGLDRVHNEAGTPQSLLAERRAAAQRVINYERRLVSDGLVDGPLPDPLGYDIGRAVALARWGLVCRLIDAGTAQGIVDRAAQQAFARYGSWDEFGSSYVLGRIIAFDDDEVGEWYATSAASLSLLRSAPDSPWRLNPWPLPKPTADGS